jgi:predicted Zn-dependent protease
VLNVRKLALTSILLLVLGLTLLVSTSKQPEAQQEHSIEVTGYTWDHSTISVSILPRESESWWKPSYLDATLHGVAQWNDAIQKFAANHTEFLYLSAIRLVPTINYENVSGFDIYIGWIEECGSESTIGQSRATIRLSCLTINNTVCLTAKAPSGHVMTEADMQNIVVHELGHTFGLYHCSYSGDVMYSIVNYRATVKPLSSLDLYALSQSFKWMTNSSQFTSSSTCPQESSVTLPSSISYVHFPIAAENLPASTPQNLIEYTIELFQRPEILESILIAVTLLVVLVIILKSRKKLQSS